MAVRPEEHFSSTYVQARERFLAVAAERGAVMDGHAIAAQSLGGQELTIDTAYIGPASPQRVLAISSATHGVEGFAGSAIQHRVLRDQLPTLALSADCGLLLVHALNPFGFSAVRRVNENNVDLNRNFVSHPEGHAANPGYEELYDAVNPVRMDAEEEAKSRAAMGAFANAHGLRALQSALSAGQYAHPEGVQFGGQVQEESNLWLRDVARAATRSAPQVVWLDIHTGLGPYGEIEMIMEAPEDSQSFIRARSVWGDSVRSLGAADSVSPGVHGSIMAGLAQALAQCDLTVVGAEFGTYNAARVFAAMRADNWLHRFGETESERGRAVKLELAEVFRPDDRAWQAKVLDVAAGVIARWAAVHPRE